ncbi:uncharacterized protein [Coffea arabica]|uniref:Uncharacterized protein n=1 Tax=Coffea arabica TaxID=13443 RepID=A0ABM4W8D5_COFAR
MAENSQHFGTREDTSTRHVNNVGILSMQEQLAELTSMVHQMAMKNVQQVKKYEICKDVSHPTDGCPMLQDDSMEQVNMVGHTPVPHRQYDSYSNTYNPVSVEDRCKYTRSKKLVSQIASVMNSLKFQGLGKLPSQPKVNLKNVSAITLISEKKIEGPKPIVLEDKSEDQIEKEKEEEGFIKTTPERLCVYKKKLRGDERIVMEENVSAVQKNLPPKCGDQETDIIIQLADRTNAYPVGLVEDILVQVNELVFPREFYILDMNDKRSLNSSPVILGRSFLSTSRIKIDVNESTLTMEFDGEVAHFNIFYEIKNPVNSHFVLAIHATNPSVQKFSEFDCRGKFKIVTNKYHRMKAIYEVKMS